MQPEAEAGAESSDDAAVDDNVVDAEFEEVDDDESKPDDESKSS